MSDMSFEGDDIDAGGGWSPADGGAVETTNVVSYKIISDPGQTSTYGIGDVLGSIGTLVQNAATIGRDIGTMVGTAQKNVNTGVANYQTAKNAASTTSPTGGLQQWWLYSSTTDKLAIGLAAIGVLLILKKG